MTNNKVRQIKTFIDKKDKFINWWLNASRDDITLIDIRGRQRGTANSVSWRETIIYEIDYDKISEFELAMRTKEKIEWKDEGSGEYED